jgi:heterotetrameric sarcosine oxidase gamma subunit
MASRLSPLTLAAKQGRFGADKGAPGVTLAVRHPLSTVLLMARKGKTRALGVAMKNEFGVALPGQGLSTANGSLALHWCGAEQWYAVRDHGEEGAFYRDLTSKLSGLASCVDQSHGRVTIRIAGRRAPDVLAKGTPIDLHPRVFGPGRAAVTQMAHVGVHLAQIDDDTFDLSIFRGFAESFWEWLELMSEEFGYDVR